MRHHFRFAGSAGSEIHQRNIIVGICMSRTYERGGILYSLMEIFETFGDFRADADQFLDSRAVGKGIFDMLQDDSFTGGYNHFDVGSVATVDNILFCQQVSGGDNGCSQLVKGDGAVPELVTAFQNQHHHVTATDAQALEVRGGHVRIALHVGK